MLRILGGESLRSLEETNEAYTALQSLLRREEEPPHWQRVVVEKPFGYDLEGAMALDHALHQCFAESRIFRIVRSRGKMRWSP